jgi:hypothetical protein
LELVVSTDGVSATAAGGVTEGTAPMGFEQLAALLPHTELDTQGREAFGRYVGAVAALSLEAGLVLQKRYDGGARVLHAAAHCASTVKPLKLSHTWLLISNLLRHDVPHHTIPPQVRGSASCEG